MNEVVLTSDFSSSVYSAQFDALYHSKHGAIQESLHVFLRAGLDEYVRQSPLANSKMIKILEIGFGTGLNAFLTAIQAQNNNQNIVYTALEAYPIDMELVGKLNYSEKLGHSSLFQKIHEVGWEEKMELLPEFIIEKKLCLFQAYISDEKYDVIYFDAFAPNTQEELWNIDMMKKMYSLSRNGSILVTYCAKGVVRRTLQEAGFTVFKIPGPPGKREMLRAIRTS